MKYFLLFAVILTLLQKRNPLTFVKNVEIQWPLIIIISFGTQIVLAFIAIETQEKFNAILILTFTGVIIGLIKNRKIKGVSWIIAGALLNLAALFLHGGLMPVSETALHMTGQSEISFDTDSRHQLMDKDTYFWILGDWIPAIRYVLSPGDFFVGIGIILLISRNSSKFLRNGEAS